MKALICALNTKYVHSSLAPWCLKASAEKYAPQVKCEIVESTINENEEKILERLLEKEFDLIGFSTYIWNVRLVLSICRAIKQHRDVKILLGGPEVSYNAKEILEKNSCIDYIISGEGELPFAKLCNNECPKSIEGLCHRDGEKIIERSPYISKETLPSPYSQEYFLSLENRIAYIETSRGCPYRCAFCLSGRCQDVRFFDTKQAMENILALANSGAKTIKFIDRTFNADRARAREIFAFIIDNYGDKIPDTVCFHFEIEGDILEDTTIELLSRAKPGTIQMEIGLQSFNKETLRAINRKTDTTRLCDNIMKLVALGNIHIHIDLIAGLPFEGYDSFAESFNRALNLRPHMLQLGFLKLLYGSELRDKMEEYLYDCDENPPYEVRSTRWLAREDINSIHIVEDFLERFYNSGRFLRTSNYIMEKFDNPFKIYTELGAFVKNKEKTRSLDEFSELVYEYLAQLPQIDNDLLRDYMAMDRLATNRMGSLPEFLKIHSPTLKEILTLLDEDLKTKRKHGVKRAITLLKTRDSAIYVDYDDKNPVTGQYNLFEMKI